jgi:hypothetical protein
MVLPTCKRIIAAAAAAAATAAAAVAGVATADKHL